MLGQIGHRAAEHDRQLGAKNVGNAGEQQAEVNAEVGESPDGGKHIASPPVHNEIEQCKIFVFVHEAERIAHALRGDVAGAEREHLVGERERVAHGPIGRPREHGQGIRFGADFLGLQNGGEPVAHIGRTNTLEIEALHAREHRRCGLGDFLRIGRGEHKYHARRRLFENFQERIPRFARQHMRFVNDVNFVMIVAAGCIHRPFAKVTGIVDAAVRRGIDFDDIERRRSGPDAGARRTGPARFAVVAAVFTVERHREHAGKRRFPSAAGAAKQIRVRDMIGDDRIAQRRCHVRLDCHIGETFGAILSREGQGHNLKLLSAPLEG